MENIGVEIINGRESFAGQAEYELIVPVLIQLIVLVLVNRFLRFVDDEDNRRSRYKYRTVNFVNFGRK